MTVIGLTGRGGAAFVASCDAGVAVPSGVVARIQECHITIGHLWCEAIDEALAPTFGPPAASPANHDPAAGPGKLFSLDALIAWREAQRARKRTVVWTNGVFDVLRRPPRVAARRPAVRRRAGRQGQRRPSVPSKDCAADLPLRRARGAARRARAGRRDPVFDEPTPERVLGLLQPMSRQGADHAPPHVSRSDARSSAYGGGSSSAAGRADPRPTRSRLRS
jgi:hypothetical protein